MTVDPAVVQALAEMLADATSGLPVPTMAIERGWGDATVDEMDNILAELREDDLYPAVRAAADRLTAQKSAGPAEQSEPWTDITEYVADKQVGTRPPSAAFVIAELGTLPASAPPIVAEDGCTLTVPSKRPRMTDGCGPEHTFTGSCELEDWGSRG